MKKVNLQIENGIIIGYTEIPLDETKKIYELKDEELEFINKNLGAITEQFMVIQDEITSRKIDKLRERRETECFSVVNRGALWYSTLSELQLSQLKDWYEQWLDVTETFIIPEKPEWLK